ncbi:MAG: response regulator [Desulfobacteraceae bacterium]|nr:response regulator [Desulfobacteraceae bacterium]
MLKSKKKVMIVEDDWFIADDTKRRVENLGYTVSGIEPSGEEAIKAVENDPPDLILMDIILKGEIDGVQAAQKINTNHNIPIIYVTAFADENLMERVRTTGPYGYITKPFKESELHTAIEIAFYKQEMEAKLLQDQKLKAIGILAGGIAHDFNNILYPVMGFAEILKEEISSDSPLQEYIDEILIGTERASELVKQILTISQHTHNESKPLRIQSILEEVLKLSRSILPASIQIKQDISADCGMIMADPTQIHQMIMNLTTNAFHAMETDGGALSFSLRQIDLSTECNFNLNLSPGPYICLTVSDTGVGINSDTKEKIFDPYFSTKEKHKGTGLGLSVVDGIVKTYNGKIVCRSKLKKGTTFDIYLPRIVSDVVDSSDESKMP